MSRNGETLRAFGGVLHRPADHVAARVTSPGPKWCTPPSINDLPERICESELREGGPAWRAYMGYRHALDELHRRRTNGQRTDKAEKKVRHFWRALEVVLSPRGDNV